MRSGFTIVRNAVRLDYPIVPAIRSILALCDEVIVNVGRSDDGTRDVVAAIGDRRVRILDSVWDFTRGSETLSIETNRAMRACRGSWGVYIQADEVLHETAVPILSDALAACEADPRVEGLTVDYLHFYGDVDTVATNRHWYRREVRVVRLGRDIHSFHDAQGFRAGPGRRRIGARVTGARMFHYGWARTRGSLQGKLAASQEIFTGGGAPERHAERSQLTQLEWTPLLRRFTGKHPSAAREWVAARRASRADAVRSRRFRAGDLRYYLSDWIEQLTGSRVFEYRNYEPV